MDYKKLGYAVRQKRGQRGYRAVLPEFEELGNPLEVPYITAATISRVEHSGKITQVHHDEIVRMLLAWVGKTEAEVDAIELPPFWGVSESKRQPNTCFHCKTPLTRIGVTQCEEEQTVKRIKYYEDDAEWEYADETFTMEALSGYCPKCKEWRTQDSYSGLWW